MVFAPLLPFVAAALNLDVGYLFLGGTSVSLCGSTGSTGSCSFGALTGDEQMSFYSAIWTESDLFNLTFSFDKNCHVLNFKFFLTEGSLNLTWK